MTPSCVLHPAPHRRRIRDHLRGALGVDVGDGVVVVEHRGVESRLRDALDLPRDVHLRSWRRPPSEKISGTPMKLIRDKKD